MTENPVRKLAVLLHVDVVDSTALVQQNESLAHERIRDTFRRLSATIDSHNGIAHEIRGDALVAEFARASDAVEASLAFQAANTAHNEELSEDIRPAVRIGIAMGEVVVADNTVTGEGVVIAQRLEQLACPGGVCIQGAVYDTVPKRLPIDYEHMGERELKGIGEPVRVYAVRLKAEALVQAALSSDSAEPMPRLPDKPSIAVLPFTNMSGDPEQEYFSDGITEDLITALSCYRSFSVVARNSVFVYKGQSVDVRRVASELGARYILEGSIRKSGARVRTTAQLIDAQSGNHIWAERYDRDLVDIFDLQDEIVEIISGRLGPEVDATEMHRAALKSTRNLAAWDCYHLGMVQFFKFNKDGNAKAQQLMRRAIDLDPKFGPPYSRLAYAIILAMVYYDADPVQEKLDEALAHARKGVEIDEKDAWAHLALGRVHLARREYDFSLAQCEVALQLNPYLGAAHCGMADALTFMERMDESIPRFEASIRLSPQDPLRWAFYAYRSLAHLFRRDYELAVEWANNALQVPNCEHWANAHLAAALGHLGRSDEAAAAAAELLRRNPQFSIEYARNRLFYIRSSDQVAHYIDGLRKAGVAEL